MQKATHHVVASCLLLSRSAAGGAGLHAQLRVPCECHTYTHIPLRQLEE